MTPRKSPPPLMILMNHVGWGLCRRICRWLPGLGRAFNFPLREAFVGDFANSVLEDIEQQIVLTTDGYDVPHSASDPTPLNNHGDQFTDPAGGSRVHSLLLKIDHCIVLGRGMKVLDESGAFVLALASAPSDQAEIKPSLLKTRDAPEGLFYTLGCNGDLLQFFAKDVLPLLYFMHRHEAEIDALHIVTHANFPPFVWDTLQAISAKYEKVKVLSLKNDERLVNVTALWCSRTAQARDCIPTTREEADGLGQLLSTYHQLPPVPASSRLLFVSRGDAPLRRLKNEAELITDLLDLDFEYFVPRSNDHRSQIEAFRSARIVVAVHGAGLANLLFCQPGTLVIELFPAKLTNYTYRWLALQLGLRYRAVVGFSGDETQAFSVKVPLVIAEVEAELGIDHQNMESEDPSDDEIDEEGASGFR